LPIDLLTTKEHPKTQKTSAGKNDYATILAASLPSQKWSTAVAAFGLPAKVTNAKHLNRFFMRVKIRRFINFLKS